MVLQDVRNNTGKDAFDSRSSLGTSQKAPRSSQGEPRLVAAEEAIRDSAALVPAELLGSCKGPNSVRTCTIGIKGSGLLLGSLATSRKDLLLYTSCTRAGRGLHAAGDHAFVNVRSDAGTPGDAQAMWAKGFWHGSQSVTMSPV